MNRIVHTLVTLIALTTATAFAEDLKFKLVPNYFDVKPGGQDFGPHHGGIILDQAGNIYVSSDTPRGIDMYTSDGKFVKSLGPTRIHGMEMVSEKGEEFIYGARPSDHEVVKLKLDGTLVWAIHYPAEATSEVNGQPAPIYKEAKDFNPCAVTTGPDGSVFVADGYGKNYVLKFDANQKFVKAFGGPGSDQGKFSTCHGIALDDRQGKPLLLVCNRANRRVEYWDLDGNFVKVVQKELRLPSAVQIRGNFAVIAELEGRVVVLDKDGNIASILGDNPNTKQRANYGVPPAEWTEGIFNAPHGASIDKQGNILVTEWNKFGRVHKFVPATVAP